MTRTKEPHSLSDILDELQKQAGDIDGKRMTLGDIMDTFGRRSFGPLLLVPGLIAVTPIGAIPGMPTALAVLVVLIAGQMLLGIDHPWLPDRILSISFGREKLEKGIEKGRKWAKRVDRLLEHRISALTHPPAVQIVAAVCVLIAVAVPPLELVPFAVFAPALAIVLFGLGLVARDGVLVVAGLVLSAATLGLVVVALT